MIKAVIVDDDPEVREVVGRCLLRFGASVTLCQDAFEAVSAVNCVRPDIVIVDLNMPARDGFDLLRDIRFLGKDNGGNVPVIVVTGVRDPDLGAMTRKAGFAYHLSKPFSPIELLISITQTLDGIAPLARSVSAASIIARSPESVARV